MDVSVFISLLLPHLGTEERDGNCGARTTCHQDSLACRHGERFPASKLHHLHVLQPHDFCCNCHQCQYLQLPRCGRLEANAFAMPRRGCSRCRSNRPRQPSTCGPLWLCAPNRDDSNRQLHRPEIMRRRLESLRLPFASSLGALSESVCGTSWWR